ncbi:MAG: hypothetical protein PHR25_05615 [Clostridia bacterium]|nr:hypothetical protein [Clostridia bacterium]MDD4376243.1 hypothetical protein [Clostridia bacterium]
MNNVCFAIVVREQACQNGVPVTSEKSYSNISSMENILLNFGYTLTISSYGSSSILLAFNNPTLGYRINFSITNPGIGIFDLPIDGGSYRITILSQKRPCNISCVCNDCNSLV